MDNKKIKSMRLSELIDKIYHAENARDHYKDTHPLLYETNSFYIDALKMELSAFFFPEQG